MKRATLAAALAACLAAPAVVALAPPASAAGGQVFNEYVYSIRVDTNSNGAWDRWLTPGAGLAGVDAIILPAGTCLTLHNYPSGGARLYGSKLRAVTVKVSTGDLKLASAYYCHQSQT